MEDYAQQQSLLHQLAGFLVGEELTGNLDELVKLSLAQGVGGYFLYRLRQEEINLSEHTELQPLVTATRHQVARYMLQERAMLEVNAALTDAGIKPIWIKGAILAHTVYPESALRPMADLDVLVAADDFQGALEILTQQGYGFPDDYVASAFDAISHEAHLIHSKYGNIHLELHRKLLGFAGHAYLPESILAEWIEDSDSIALSDQVIQTLKPECHFLYLCGHAYIQHGDATVMLRHLLDLDLLIRSNRIDWQMVLTWAKQLGWMDVFAHALKQTNAYFHSPIPPECIDLSIKAQNNNLVERMQFTDNRAEATLTYLGGLPLRDRIAFLVQLIFPPQDFLRQRYHITANRPAWPYYLYRWFDQGYSTLIALFRRLIYTFNHKSADKSNFNL